MPNRKNLLALLFLLTAYHSAFAAGGHDSPASEWLLSLLPIGLFLPILYFIIRQQFNTPAARRQQENSERQIQHMQRVEELLGRIANALEKNNKL